MVTKELIEYIKTCREQNISDEQIKSTLKEQGWADEDINAGLAQVPQYAEPIQLAESPESAETQKPKKKFLIPVIIIIGIIILGGAAWAGYNYWLKPGASEEQPLQEQPISQGQQGEANLDETVDWKTYKFEKGGCQINYPKEWEEKSQEYLTMFYSQDKPSIIFSIVAHKLTTAEETECIPSFYKDIGVRIIGKEVINGLNFCEMTTESDGEVLTVYYNAIKENNSMGNTGETICDIGFYYSGYYQGKDSLLSDKNEEEIQILKKMLSTFKFLLSDETADWKTYKNEKYGFELKHPSDYEIQESNDREHAILLPSDFPQRSRLFISAGDNPENKTLLELFISDQPESYESITINNLPAVRAVYPESLNFGVSNYNKFVVLFMAKNEGREAPKEDEEILKKIVGTIHILPR